MAGERGLVRAGHVGGPVVAPVRAGRLAFSSLRLALKGPYLGQHDTQVNAWSLTSASAEYWAQVPAQGEQERLAGEATLHGNQRDA